MINKSRILTAFALTAILLLTQGCSTMGNDTLRNTADSYKGTNNA